MPTDYAPSNRVLLARLDAELAEARVREGYFNDHLFAATTSGAARSPEEYEAELANVHALILELEERRETLLAAPGGPALAAPPPTPTNAPEYVSTAEAATILGISRRTLEGLRAKGQGPECVRIGKRVLYPLASLRGPAK